MNSKQSTIKGIIRDNIKIALTNNIRLQEKIASTMREVIDPVVYVNLRNEVLEDERELLRKQIRANNTNLSGKRRKIGEERSGKESFAHMSRGLIRKALTEVNNGANLEEQLHNVYDELFELKAKSRGLDDIEGDQEYTKVYQYARSSVRLEMRRHVSPLLVMEFNKAPMFDSEVDAITRSRVWTKQ